MRTSIGRRERVAQWLAAEKCDVLVSVSSGFHSFLEPNTVFVLSDVKPMAPSAVIVRRDATAALIITPDWDRRRAEAASSTETTIGAVDLVEALAGALKREGLRAERIAIDGISLLPLALSERLHQVLGARARVHDGLIRHIARCRSNDELERAQKATWIAERGYRRLLEVARPGVREYELAGDIYCHMKALGGDDNFLLMSASQHNHAVRAAGSRVLEEGDIILAEITPSFEGQFVQICRTVAIGSGPPAYDEKFAILQDSMRRGQKAAVPGATLAEVTEVMNGSLREAGYGEYCRPPYMRVRGHGLGLTSNLPGDVDASNKTVLEEGMVFVMHPNQYIPETGYLMCGEPVVVTPEGARALSAESARPDRIAL